MLQVVRLQQLRRLRLRQLPAMRPRQRLRMGLGPHTFCEPMCLSHAVSDCPRAPAAPPARPSVALRSRLESDVYAVARSNSRRLDRRPGVTAALLRAAHALASALMLCNTCSYAQGRCTPQAGRQHSLQACSNCSYSVKPRTPRASGAAARAPPRAGCRRHRRTAAGSAPGAPTSGRAPGPPGRGAASAPARSAGPTAPRL